MKSLFQNVGTIMAAVAEVEEAIRTVVATLANIEDLKPEQEECVHSFIKGKDIVSLLPMGFGKRLIQYISLHC